jgi:hypothetical protein
MTDIGTTGGELRASPVRRLALLAFRPLSADVGQTGL